MTNHAAPEEKRDGQGPSRNSSAVRGSILPGCPYCLLPFLLPHTGPSEPVCCVFETPEGTRCESVHVTGFAHFCSLHRHCRYAFLMIDDELSV